MTAVARFDRAASRYDAAARMQEEVAATLLARIAPCTPRRILDIGCGTGLLAALAAARWPKADITGLDAAPAMLAEAHKKLPAARFLAADAENIPLTEQFDLVLSSMALHWLAEPETVFSRWKPLVAPGGAMHVALPVEGCLTQWSALCHQHGVPSRLWPFPPASVFAADCDIRIHTAEHASARAFLHSMKQTGAHEPAPQSQGMPAAALRAMLRAAPKPFPADFRIAYLSWP